MTFPGRKPRVFIHEDTIFASAPLSRIVEEAGCEVETGVGDRDFCDALSEVLTPPDLIVLSLPQEASEALESVAEFRRRQWLSKTPILGVTCLDRSDLDLWKLRALGVVGLVDTRALPEHVRFRIERVVYKGGVGRRFERVACSIPVEAEVEGERVAAHAVNISVAGIGLACSSGIEPNTPIGLRFSLDEGEEPIEVSGRTTRLREVRRARAGYEVGVFFFPLSEKLQGQIGAYVSRLFEAWDSAAGVNLDHGEAAAPVEAVGSRGREGESV